VARGAVVDAHSPVAKRLRRKLRAMDDDGKTSITLDSILPRLPPEAQAWIKNMDATDYEITEKLILRNVGVETFVSDVRRGCNVSDAPRPG